MKVRLTPAAEEDVRDIYKWYKNQGQGLDAQFRGSLNDSLERISNNPAAYPKVYDEVRRVLLHRFPYGVFYMIGELEISVLGVFHGHRDPAVWQSRSIE